MVDPEKKAVDVARWLNEQAFEGSRELAWMMPSNRKLRCCDDKDCAPAESKLEDGHWVARKINNSYCYDIAPEAVEHERVSPDGRSHLCSETYMVRLFGLVDKVYCFIPGVAF